MALFGKNKNQSVLGLDIGNKMTKVVQLIFTGAGKPTLVRCDVVPAGGADESFFANMKAYLNEHSLGNSMVAASFDHASMKIRKFELPKMPEPDLIEAIRWNFRDVVVGNIDDYSVEYSMIRDATVGDENAQVEVVGYAVLRAEVLKFKTTLERLGLQPFIIEPRAVSLAATLERCQPDEEHYQAGLDIGGDQSLFYVVGKGRFVFSRPLNELGHEQAKKDPEAFPRLLAIELQKSIDTFTVCFKMETIRRVFLTGGGALVFGLTDYLSTNLGLEAAQLNVFSTLDGVERFSDVQSQLFAQAVGLAYCQP
jgi:type IV pilus assembly protein PilM